jgi:histidinol-phosphatase
VYEEELAFANGLADLAADISMHYFGGSFDVQLKEDMTPVTQADTEIERAIRRALAERFPEDAVLGEEGGWQGDGERVWVIDPIDGTKNFAGRIQIWGTLIALLQDGRPVLGVASAPALGERYEAVAGQGARLNGEAIHVSDGDALSEAMVVFGTLGWESEHAEQLRAIAAEARRTRAFGDFWSHMLVARGSAEAMLEESLRTWDTAAVQVIVEEAGGRMTAFDGGPLTDGGSALSTNGRLHEELVKRLA